MLINTNSKLHANYAKQYTLIKNRNYTLIKNYTLFENHFQSLLNIINIDFTMSLKKCVFEDYTR